MAFATTNKPRTNRLHTAHTLHTRSSTSAKQAPVQPRHTAQERVYRACWLFRKTRTHTRQPCQPWDGTPPAKGVLSWSESLGLVCACRVVCEACSRRTVWVVVRCVWRRGKEERTKGCGMELGPERVSVRDAMGEMGEDVLAHSLYFAPAKQRGSDGSRASRRQGRQVHRQAVWRRNRRGRAGVVFVRSGVRVSGRLLRFFSGGLAVWPSGGLAASHLTGSRSALPRFLFISKTHRGTVVCRGVWWLSGDQTAGVVGVGEVRQTHARAH